jgi:anti-sigma regulatory factor (Ser/Thr protein kinase)
VTLMEAAPTVPAGSRAATCTPGSDLSAVAAGRAFARAALRRWGAPPCDDLALVVSELLTNALQHAVPQPGGWAVRLGLLATPGRLLCAVSDSSPVPPLPQPPGRLDESGRGMHVIEELSDTWGCTVVHGRGKVVWASFATGGALARSAALAQVHQRRAILDI